MSEDRSVRFRWRKGEVIAEFSQCAYCKNALDYATCAEFGKNLKNTATTKNHVQNEYLNKYLNERKEGNNVRG